MRREFFNNLNDYCEGVTHRECFPIGTYSGTFTIDRSALETDGVVTTTPLSFYFALGGTIWDSSGRSDFSGYRYSCPITAQSCDYGGWTILAKDGSLEGLCCGVFGSEDFPFIDMTKGVPPNAYGVPDLFTFPGANFNIFALTEGRNGAFVAAGTISWTPIPEPSMVAIAAIALAALAVLGRRRNQGSG